MGVPELGKGEIWLTWTGFETDLIFNRNVDLPGFASFPLLNTHEGRAHILRGYQDLIDVALATGCGACLEAVTWMANAERAASLGYDAMDLARLNRAAIEIMKGFGTSAPVCFSAQIGPRGDGYDAGEMGPQAARAYHMAQVELLAGTDAELLSAYTIGAVGEAAGIALAAQAVDLPLTIAFTVETDGRLPDGTPLAEAIDAVDQETGGSVAYYLVNCAHPDHLASALDGSVVLERLAGVVANASRMSHAELDETEELDDGSPSELASQLAAIRGGHPWMRVFGGCCGTDMRHMRRIGEALSA